MSEELESKNRRIEMLQRNHANEVQRLKEEKQQALNMYWEESERVKDLCNKFEGFINQKDSEFQKMKEQYDKIRAAYERKKQDHKAIMNFIHSNSFKYNGKPLSITQMIKQGKNQLQSDRAQAQDQ